MEIESKVPTLEDLLGQAAWVRRLARSLTGDDANADDLTQDAYLAALERPPKQLSNLRGWFAQVLRNLARTSGRAEQRRMRRERAASRGEALPSTAELASDLEWQRRIAAAVLGLDDPYRSTLVLHYYRGLTLAEIARSQNEPAATVRGRLKRALDTLRTRLDQEHGGDRRAWSIALGAWAWKESRVAVPALSGIGLVILASTLVLGGAAGLLLWRSKAASDPRSFALSAATTDTQEPARAEAGRSNPLVRSPEDRSRAAIDSPPAQARSAEPRFFGTVRDSEDQPIPNARVFLYPNTNLPRPEPIGRGITDGQGKFSFAAAPAESTHRMILAEADGYSSNGVDPVFAGLEIRILLGSSVVLTGTVRDALTRLPLTGVQLTSDGRRAVTLDQGKYRFEGLSAGNEHEILARLPGYAEQQERVLLRGRQDAVFDFALAPGTPVEIEVFDQESGAPLSSVSVADYFKFEPWTHTDPRGRFTTWLAAGHSVQLDLQLDGYWPTRWIWTPAVDEMPNELRIPLLKQGWVIGQVKDKEGAPVPDALVYADGPGYHLRGLPKSELLKSWHTPGSVREGRLEMADVAGSGPDGRYRLPVLAAETPLMLRASKAGFARADSGAIVVARSSETAQMDLVLERAASIHGIARFNGVDWRGRARLLAADGTQGAQAFVEGKYSMKDVPPGTWSLQLEPLMRRGTEELPHSSITVEAGQEYTLDFVWGKVPEMGTISGRVLNPTGELPDRVSVDARPVGGKSEDRVTAQAATDGSFALQVPKGIEYSVSAAFHATRGYVSGDARTVTPDAKDVELTLPDLGLLEFRLVDAATRAPAKLVEASFPNGLRWQRLDGGSAGTESFDVDVRGGVEVQLAVGEYEVRLDLTSEGYLPIAPRTIKVTRTPPTDPEIIEVERGLEASVRVVGPPDGDRTALNGHLFFLVERSQLPSISGPFTKGDRRVNHTFGGGNGIQMRIDDPAIMNQFLAKQEFFGDGSIVRALIPGHYFIKCYPDDLILDPTEFDIPGPDRAQIRITWRTQR